MRFTGTLLKHPKIFLGADGASTDALLVRDGKIVAVGDDAAQAASPSDEVVQPDGDCVFPALCDAHIHLWGLGLRHGSAELGSARRADDVYNLLSQVDADAGPQGWVLGRDWDNNRWDGVPALDKARLDALFPSHPLVLRRVDGHALWVNSATLERAGIGPDWNPGPNGHVGRDANGQPTGLLIDDAMNPVLQAIPEPTVGEDRDVFLESCATLLRHGCSAAHVAWLPLDRIQMLTDLRDTNELPLRLHCLVDGRGAMLKPLLEEGPVLGPWLNIAGVKYFADGAMGSRGARMLDPYPDGTLGLTLEPRDLLIERCRSHAALGWQIAIHAIGDASARDVLDAFEAIPEPHRTAVRPRIEHCQTLHDDDIARFGELGVTASIQAIHMYSDSTWASEQFEDWLLDRMFRWRELQDVAPCVCGGSDFPIDDPNPWHGIAASSARKDRKGRAFRPAQALTRAEALRSYTEGAAWASFREEQCGRLEPGYAADFIVLDRDPFDASDDELWDMQVLQTWIDGRRSAVPD